MTCVQGLSTTVNTGIISNETQGLASICYFQTNETLASVFNEYNEWAIEERLKTDMLLYCTTTP